ncbi:uncharacterized protein C1orf167 homolog isoform X2 [Crotalus tigris]|uniref:uncharacterized protein C1orf167 homolog isoform X2 n=1 Tax=Crotalus tigris TaxID=88082 RepID=UPI00192F8839|nr:uncharacterized protein C1orf167 homolog isoform X2 [Crotalus tigris]
MEWPQRIQTAARKENIPPALSCCVAPKEPRNIQKNVNVDLFLSSGSHLGELWARSGASIRGSNHLGENIQKGLRVTYGRRETPGPCQTNLSCPPWGLPKASLVRQQNNLESSLHRRRWEGGNLKETPPRAFPERPRDVPRNPSQIKHREGYLLKRPHELFAGSRRSHEDLKARGESSSPIRFSGHPSLRSSPERCPLSMTFSGIGDSSPPGPPLTLDSLKSSALVDGHSSPEGAQAPLRSSQSSADQCRSLRGLKKERSSFSCESRLPSWLPQPAGGPQISTLAVRKIQASVEVRSKWRTMLSATLLTCQGDCSRSSSGTPQGTNKKASLNELRDQGDLRTLDPEGRHSGTFCGSELYLKNLPLDVFSLRSLESSLKTLRAESSPNRRLSMEDTRGEKPPTLDPSGAPEILLGHLFGKNVGDLPTHEAGDKYGEAGEDPITPSSVEEAGLLSTHQKVHLFEETIWKGPRKGFQPVWPPHLRKDGGLLREYFVLLENKKLGGAFNRWRSHCGKKQQVRLLAFRIQSGLIRRCFKAWQSLAQWKRDSKAAVEHLWAQSLRVSFRQWCLTVQARRSAKRAVIELLWAKGPGSGGPRGDPDRRKWPPKYAENALDSLFHLRMLQEAFLTWKARCQEARWAGAFYRDSTLRQLREALARWRRRTRVLSPLGLTEGSLLVSADLQESPSSALPSASQEQIWKAVETQSPAASLLG